MDDTTDWIDGGIYLYQPPAKDAEENLKRLEQHKVPAEDIRNYLQASPEAKQAIDKQKAIAELSHFIDEAEQVATEYLKYYGAKITDDKGKPWNFKGRAWVTLPPLPPLHKKEKINRENQNKRIIAQTANAVLSDCAYLKSYIQFGNYQQAMLAAYLLGRKVEQLQVRPHEPNALRGKRNLATATKGGTTRGKQQQEDREENADHKVLQTYLRTRPIEELRKHGAATGIFRKIQLREIPTQGLLGYDAVQRELKQFLKVANLSSS